MNSVVSAAIIEGNLIIGLSDGSIINCGFVQGPQGLSGPQGPMGATGDNGTDGNTIITIGGTPGNEMGSDGDYAIDNINWRIYGPKSGGVWGKAKEMLPGPENILENGRAPSGGSGGGSMGGSGSGGGGGGIVYTNTVQLTNPVTTLLRSTANYKIIPNAPAGTTNQEGANLWGFGSCFDNFDAAIPVATGSLPPTPLPGFADNWDGRLWFDSNEDELTLYIYNNGAWIPAAPPVSLDGINATIDAALVVQNDLLDRVTAGETTQTALQGTVSTALTTQQQILTDLGDLETEAQDYASKTKDNTFTGNNEFTNNLILPELPSENTHGTNKFYTDAQDTILHGMVDVIVGRRVYSKYQLQKDDKSLRSGKFKLLLLPQHDSEITQADDWADVNYIYFSYDDYDGHRRSLTELKVGDQLSMESSNSAATFIINQTKVNGLDNFFGVARSSSVGDPTRPHVYQMVAGDEGRITAEEVGEIVLNRFNAVDAVRNSYGKIFTGVQSYDPNTTLAPGTIAWDGGSDMYISDTDSNNFSWSSNTNTTFTLDSKQYFTIYSETSSGQIGSMHLRGSFTTFFKSSKHVKLGGIEKLHGSSTLYSNKWYIVNLGGFM